MSEFNKQEPELKFSTADYQFMGSFTNLVRRYSALGPDRRRHNLSDLVSEYNYQITQHELPASEALQLTFFAEAMGVAASTGDLFGLEHIRSNRLLAPDEASKLTVIAEEVSRRVSMGQPEQIIFGGLADTVLQEVGNQQPSERNAYGTALLALATGATASIPDLPVAEKYMAQLQWITVQ